MELSKEQIIKFRQFIENYLKDNNLSKDDKCCYIAGYREDNKKDYYLFKEIFDVLDGNSCSEHLKKFVNELATGILNLNKN